jgi:cell division protease FtsH
MVCEWGMSEKMGMVEYGEHEDYVFLGREISKNRNYSEATAQEIDSEVHSLCENAHQIAKEQLLKHRHTLEAIAKALLEYETLEGSHIREIMDHGSIQNPPVSTHKPPAAKPPPLKPRPAPQAEEDLPPGLAGPAPA